MLLPPYSQHPNVFSVFCCGRRRGLFPGGVIVCPVCDFNHDGLSVMPNEQYAKDIPGTSRHWEVPRA